jgi:hypothetical protein
MVEDLKNQSAAAEARATASRKKSTANKEDRSTFHQPKGKVKFDDSSVSIGSDYEDRRMHAHRRMKAHKKGAGRRVDPNSEEAAYAIRKPSKETLANTRRWYVVLRVNPAMTKEEVTRILVADITSESRNVRYLTRKYVTQYSIPSQSLGHNDMLKYSI